MRLRSLVIAAALCAFAFPYLGCQTAATGEQSHSIPAPLASRAGELPADEADQARKIYTAKCARCHKFYNPADYSDAEWHSWMTRMSRKARLSASQADLVSRYLETFRPLPTSNPTPGP